METITAKELLDRYPNADMEAPALRWWANLSQEKKDFFSEGYELPLTVEDIVNILENK